MKTFTQLHFAGLGDQFTVDDYEDPADYYGLYQPQAEDWDDYSTSESLTTQQTATPTRFEPRSSAEGVAIPAILVAWKTGRPANAGLSLVELAGLEPATSWVR